MTYRKPVHLCTTHHCRGQRHCRGGGLCGKCMMRRWRKQNPMGYRLAVLRQRARRKELPFDLTVDWLTEFLTREKYDPLIHHIDRICSLGGYTKRNLQVLPISDNIAKGNRERNGQSQLY